MIYAALLFLLIAALGATALLYLKKSEKLEHNEEGKLKKLILGAFILFFAFLALHFLA